MNKHSKSWYALYTRSKHEKKICFFLKQKGIETYLPMTTKMRQWSDRMKKVELPLFPSYVFVHIHKSKLWHATESPGAIRFIGIGKSPTPIPDKVIESLQKVEKESLTVDNLNFYKGEKVKIISGKFIGVEGEFVRKGVKNILAIGIEMMNRVVIVELEASQVQQLQKIEPQRATGVA